MQTREQMKNWKVVASVASVAALGLTGLAVASPDDQTEAPPAIQISDRQVRGEVFLADTIPPTFQVVTGPVLDVDDTFDSPVATGIDSPDDSPEVATGASGSGTDDSPDDTDSPDDSPDSPETSDTDDSLDSD